MPYRMGIAAQVLLLAYFETCMLIPLGAWNAQPGMNRAFSLGNVILGSVIGSAQLSLLVGTVRSLKSLMWMGLAGDTIWFGLHVQSLWIPYIVGASPEYAGMYARVFGKTTKLLPGFGNHLAPDAMHTLIDVLLIAVIVTLALHMFQSATGFGRPSSSHNTRR